MANPTPKSTPGRIVGHMPGPWKVGYDALDVLAPHPKGGFAGGYAKVCDIRGWGFLAGQGALGLPEDEAKAIQEANARLIAAAPDMLTALKALDAALTDAGFGSPDDKLTRARLGGIPCDAWLAGRAAIAKAEGR